MQPRVVGRQAGVQHAHQHAHALVDVRALGLVRAVAGVEQALEERRVRLEALHRHAVEHAARAGEIAHGVARIVQQRVDALRRRHRVLEHLVEHEPHATELAGTQQTVEQQRVRVGVGRDGDRAHEAHDLERTIDLVRRAVRTNELVVARGIGSYAGGRRRRR